MNRKAAKWKNLQFAKIFWCEKFANAAEGTFTLRLCATPSALPPLHFRYQLD